MKGATNLGTVKRQTELKEQILFDPQHWILNGVRGDSKVQIIGVTQGAHGQSTERGKTEILYKIGVTDAPHQKQ